MVRWRMLSGAEFITKSKRTGGWTGPATVSLFSRTLLQDLREDILPKMMMWRSVFLKAEKQLLSLCTDLINRSSCRYKSKRQLSSFRFEQQNLVYVLPPQTFDGLRCFASVPQGLADDHILSGKIQDRVDQQHVEDIISQEVESGHNSNASDDEQDKNRHIPVMAKEVLTCLDPKDNQLVVDMTFGAGGHAQHILMTTPGIRYIAVDRDPVAFGLAQEFASKYRKGQVTPLLSKFSELPGHLDQLNIQPGSVDCVLMDLGVSSMQFDTASRGFGLSHDGPLDMRMDGHRFPESPTAADVLNSLEAHDLAHIIKRYGEEKKAKAIAYAIIEARYAFGPIVRTKQLADIIKNVFNSNFRHDKLHRHSHVATKTFQALRIFVNDELNEVHNGLEVAHRYLKPGGRCAIISFHSLEDRIVKRHFHDIEMDTPSNISIHGYFRNNLVSYANDEIKEKFLVQNWLPLQRKIMEPSKAEVMRNPRARSAKLRAAVKAIHT